MPQVMEDVRSRARISLVTIDPANVPTIVAPEQNVALPGAKIGDVILPFPAAALTAGITVRASIVDTDNLFSFRCVNPTVGGVNAAAAVWALANLRSFPQRDVTIDPANVLANVAPNQNITIRGLKVGDVVIAVPPPTMTADVDFIATIVAADNTLTLRGCNPTGLAVNAASAVWRLINLRGARVSLFVIDPGNVVQATAPNVDVVVPGIMPGDCVLAIPPSTLTADVFPVTLRAPAANTIRLRIANPTGGAIDPASDTWALVNFGQ